MRLPLYERVFNFTCSLYTIWVIVNCKLTRLKLMYILYVHFYLGNMLYKLYKTSWTYSALILTGILTHLELCNILEAWTPHISWPYNMFFFLSRFLMGNICNVYRIHGTAPSSWWMIEVWTRLETPEHFPIYRCFINKIACCP